MPQKTLILGRRQTGKTLAAVLAESFEITPRQTELYLKNRWVRLDGELCRHASQRVRRGQKLQISIPKEKPRPTAKAPKSRVHRHEAPLPPIPIVYLDDAILVVDKPAGLTTVRHADETKAFGNRARRFLPPTLIDLLPKVLPANARKGRLRAVHRLDKETSGLVVIARTPAAESALGKQFRAHAVERTYLAVVRGEPKEERIESLLVADRGDGRRGSGSSGDGQRAVTHVRVLEKMAGFTHVECRLETGRTHQVRIHLGERGTPLCGERIYDRPLHGQPLPDASGAGRPMLHAATLGLVHPTTGEHMAWERPMPADMRQCLERCRERRPV